VHYMNKLFLDYAVSEIIILFMLIDFLGTYYIPLHKCIRYA